MQQNLMKATIFRKQLLFFIRFWKLFLDRDESLGSQWPDSGRLSDQCNSQPHTVDITYACEHEDTDLFLEISIANMQCERMKLARVGGDDTANQPTAKPTKQPISA